MAAEYLAPEVGSWAGAPLLATYPLPVQAAAVLGLLAVLTASSAVLAGALRTAFRVLEPGPALLGMRAALALPVGAFFIGIGVLHLVLPQDYAGIVPPFGTWGIWPVPGPALFHAYWTGVAHLLGGAALLFMESAATAGWLLSGVRGLPSFLPWQRQLPTSEQVSLFLLVQTAAVSPANIYMFTHGVNTLSYLAPLGPIPYPEGHIDAFIGVAFVLGTLGALAGDEGAAARAVGPGQNPWAVALGTLAVMAGVAGAVELLNALAQLVSGLEA